jgi:excinuclease UvrABC ATPase subunit
MYVLDEPSRSACTSATIERLLSTLLRLRDLGNTVIVVEHDEEAIQAWPTMWSISGRVPACMAANHRAGHAGRS